jgi:hypothetical protein
MTKKLVLGPKKCIELGNKIADAITEIMEGQEGSVGNFVDVPIAGLVVYLIALKEELPAEAKVTLRDLIDIAINDLKRLRDYSPEALMAKSKKARIKKEEKNDYRS